MPSSGPTYSRIPESEESCLSSDVLTNLSLDTFLLLQAKALRMFSYGILGVMLGLYLRELGYSEREVGMVFTFTLLGDCFISLMLTTHADRYGRKYFLLIGSLVSVVTSIIFITGSSHPIVLIIAGTLGVISPSGYEVGPFTAIEISCFAQITSPELLTKLLGWYNLFGCVACALGSLTCGFILNLLQNHSFFQQGVLESYKTTLIIYTFVQFIIMLIFLCLSHRIELPKADRISKSSLNSSVWFGLRKSRGVMITLSFLFAIDAFAASLIIQTLVSNWFVIVYNTPLSALGLLFFACNLLAGICALFSATIASSVGLIWSIVFTDVSSSVFAVFVPLMPNEILAIVILSCQFSLSQMAIPTRSAYIQGIVEPDERSAANGVTNLARSIGSVFGPIISGYLLSTPGCLDYPWFISGCLKICYDLLLLCNFRSVISTSDV